MLKYKWKCFIFATNDYTLQVDAGLQCNRVYFLAKPRKTSKFNFNKKKTKCNPNKRPVYKSNYSNECFER